ncbi:MAG: tetratricopeptide repeat protein [Phocaeicola sp.]
MFQYIYTTTILLLVSVATFAQKTERDYLRSGNKQYNDSLFMKAEVDYRKALDVDPQSADAMFNLSNSLLMQEKPKEAMEMLETVAKVEKDKEKLAECYHNMGVIMQASKQYGPAVEAYKKALRNNPTDNETRYNLALAQKMLKDQEQQKEDKKEDKQDQKEEEKKEQEKQEQNKEQQKEEEQNQDKNQQDQNKEEQKEKEEKEQQQQQQNPNQMSKENAEQLLNSVMQDEKEVQEKMKKQLQMQGKKLEKDW